MKIQSKEELQKALTKLKNSKDKKQNCHYTPPSMAMCYSMSLPRYYKGHFIGRHKCISCGKDFGTDINDEISLCQEKRYQDYLKSQYLFFAHYPCFEDFYKKYNEDDLDVLEYLKEQGLIFKNNNKYNGYSEFGFDDDDSENDVPQSFNRPLTKEEWVKLNTNCDKKHCFEMDSYYETFKYVYQQYKDAGYDVRLEYNCPQCCRNGKHEIEFWIKLDGCNEYVISYPKKSHKNSLNGSAYTDYMIALDFLTGSHTYNQILKKSFERDVNIEHLQIDNALNKIVKNIKYDKSELKQEIADMKLGLNENKIIDNIFNLYEGTYKFTVGEYYDLLDNVKTLNDDDLSKISLSSKMEIVEKRTILHLKGIDDFISNGAIYEYFEKNYPKGKIVYRNIDTERDIDISKRYDEENYIVREVLNLIFDVYGKNFKISVSLFEKLVEDFYDKLWGCTLEDIEKIKELMLKEEYIKNLVEGD